MAEPVVETEYGRVQGIVHGGVNTFLGIPYGAPTGGANRFKAPERPAAWSGVRDVSAIHGPIQPCGTLPNVCASEVVASRINAASAASSSPRCDSEFVSPCPTTSSPRAR